MSAESSKCQETAHLKKKIFHVGNQTFPTSHVDHTQNTQVDSHAKSNLEDLIYNMNKEETNPHP